MRALAWPHHKARQNATRLVRRWRKQQEGITTTRSPVDYVELKRHSTCARKAHLAAATRPDPATFTIIPSSDGPATHHQILDSRGYVLGYRQPIPADLLQRLRDSTADLPHVRPTNTVRGQFTHRHYAVWRDYAAVPFQSSEYRRDGAQAVDWVEQNTPLFEYLSNGLRMINPQSYARIVGAAPHLRRQGLEPLCGAWYGVAINQAATGSTGVHQDWGDHGYNCVVPWGEYQGGELILWQLRLKVALRPGDAFFFAGSLIAHNAQDIVGERNSIDVFCHHNVLSWRDQEVATRRGWKPPTPGKASRTEKRPRAGLHGTRPRSRRPPGARDTPAETLSPTGPAPG